jgi:hydrogenase maturation protease
VTAATLVVGVGNPLRGDDGAGPAVADRLRGRVPDDVEVACERGDLAELLERLEGRDRVVVIDAAVGAGPPGRIVRFDASAAALPSSLDAGSTHGLGLAAALELLRVQGRLPARVVVYAIAGASFAPGAELTPAVAHAVTDVAARVGDEVNGAPCSPRRRSTPSPCRPPRGCR